MILEGVRVVELAGDIAGPYVGKLFADAGADVVKVEPAAGDQLRRWRSGALFDFLNTSKRSVVGGIEDEEIFELCCAADVVVEEGRPGAFPLDAVHARNAQLVVVSITPYGQTGPWAGRPATEFTLQAWCGSTGGRGMPERPPLAAGGRIGEWVAGAYAGVAALAALTAAQRDGVGEHVDVAWLDAMCLSMNTYTSVFAELSGWPPLPRPTRTVEIPSIELTADGYVSFTTNSHQQFHDFLTLIERPDKADDEDLFNALSRFKRRDEAWEMIRAYTRVRSTAELLERATLLRVPCGPVGNGAAVTGFDQFVERGVFVENPKRRFVQPRVPYRISGVASRPLAPAPGVGEHDGAIDWTPRAETTARSVEGARPLPLAGMRVLDCTAWWAGPAAGHALACLGADVIKVESTKRPDLMRYTSVHRPGTDQWWEYGPLFHGANNNKRAITLDLTQAEGRDLLLALLASADVILDNFTPRVMENFGLTWDVVHAANRRDVHIDESRKFESSSANPQMDTRPANR